MNLLKAALALAIWPVLLTSMLAGCAQSPAKEPRHFSHSAHWDPEPEAPGQRDRVLAACPMCLFATHYEDSAQTQECVPCAASWAEEFGSEEAPCANVRPLNSPAFNVCPED